MRAFFIVPVLVLVLAACSKPVAMSVEEQIIANAFAGFVSAGTYDRMCNGASLVKADPKKPEKEYVLYMGNRQLFGARMGMLWKLRNEDGTVEQGVQSLIAAEKNIDAKLEKTLKTQGCDGEAGQQGKKMFALYTNTHPAKISAMLDLTIEKQGGKVTPPEAID